jgi:hypothetical protein
MRDRTNVASVPQQLDQHRSGELLKMGHFDSVVMEIDWKGITDQNLSSVRNPQKNRMK